MQPKIFIETERLLLREMLPEDAAGMFELDSDPEVLKYIGTQPLTDIQQSRDVMYGSNISTTVLAAGL
jgi:[ribosomal protein S5]-alanine N-acetyltransferase